MPRQISKARLDELIDEAIVDCWGQEEEHTVLLTMIEERVVCPFRAKLIGETIEIRRFEWPRFRLWPHHGLAHDEGILCAPTAFGKTVVAAWLLAKRKTNTLILVHRRHLLDQWKDRLESFLELSQTKIGQIGGGRKSRGLEIDVAVMQSLIRKGKVNSLVG